MSFIQTQWSLRLAAVSIQILRFCLTMPCFHSNVGMMKLFQKYFSVLTLWFSLVRGHCEPSVGGCSVPVSLHCCMDTSDTAVSSVYLRGSPYVSAKNWKIVNYTCIFIFKIQHLFLHWLFYHKSYIIFSLNVNPQFKELRFPACFSLNIKQWKLNSRKFAYMTKFWFQIILTRSFLTWILREKKNM